MVGQRQGARISAGKYTLLLPVDHSEPGRADRAKRCPIKLSEVDAALDRDRRRIGRKVEYGEDLFVPDPVVIGWVEVAQRAYTPHEHDFVVLLVDLARVTEGHHAKRALARPEVGLCDAHAF